MITTTHIQPSKKHTTGQCADNSAVGDNNVQNMQCKVDFISICENSVTGNDNTQKIDCREVSLCSNTAFGDGNTQELKCYRSGCENRSGTLKQDLRILTRKIHFANILTLA